MTDGEKRELGRLAELLGIEHDWERELTSAKIKWLKDELGEKERETKRLRTKLEKLDEQENEAEDDAKMEREEQAVKENIARKIEAAAQ